MGSTAVWRTRPKRTSDLMTTYRVEHHERGTVHALGRLVGVAPHHTSLDPFVSALLREGIGGELFLVDETTGTIVARRRVRPFPAKPRDRFC